MPFPNETRGVDSLGQISHGGVAQEPRKHGIRAWHIFITPHICLSLAVCFRASVSFRLLIHQMGMVTVILTRERIEQNHGQGRWLNRCHLLKFAYIFSFSG